MKLTGHQRPCCRSLVAAGLLSYGWVLAVTSLAAASDATISARRFRERVQPILESHCYGCHGHGANEGNLALDAFKTDDALVSDIKLWHNVLKNVRSGVMPPAGEDRPNDGMRRTLFDWIESDVFKTNPDDPDPGRVTLRRLNRAEYRNTIRDLTGVEYDTTGEFPPDDAGYGFDNVGDAMSMSPLLMEKYLNAARAIVDKIVAGANSDGKSKRNKNERAIYRRTFGENQPPNDAEPRDAHAREILTKFARKAFRRPVDDGTLDRLVNLAKGTYTAPGQSFDAGIGSALVAVLASPRFLFRIEEPSVGADEHHPFMDEFSLASRLSYFVWSTMPDDELFTLAEQGKLRENLAAQVDRMVEDPRSNALSQNFAGQWLRARDIETIDIDPIGAMGLQPDLDELQRQLSRSRQDRERRRAENADKNDKDSQNQDRWKERERIRSKFRELKAIGEMFNDELRRAMRDETQMYFDYIVRDDRSVRELIDSNYTFLNATLAKHYGIEGVEGDQMRRVELPPGSPRGGVLTQAALLAVTSNPNRTSPVKRGLFVLENILGSPPPPPPPPNVPLLDASAAAFTDHRPTVRELQEQHRRDPLCSACHTRMDPLGLALEHFNALGMWRDHENKQPIDASGTLLTGESFSGIRELKEIIRDKRRLDFYRCLAEKLLTYAVGRGLEYYDESTVDKIVDRMDRNDGRFSRLLMGVIESAPFQKQRRENVVGMVRVPTERR